MTRKRKKESWVPLVPDSDWIPIKTPCLAPELNVEAKEPRIVLLVEFTGCKECDGAAYRLTAEEAEELAKDLVRQAAEAREIMASQTA